MRKGCLLIFGIWAAMSTFFFITDEPEKPLDAFYLDPSQVSPAPVMDSIPSKRGERIRLEQRNYPRHDNSERQIVIDGKRYRVRDTPTGSQYIPIR